MSNSEALEMLKAVEGAGVFYAYAVEKAGSTRRWTFTMFESAGEGRRIDLPYNSPKVEKPIDLWGK